MALERTRSHGKVVVIHIARKGRCASVALPCTADTARSMGGGGEFPDLRKLILKFEFEMS